MKLLHLGLILLVGILIIKTVDAYNKEGFDFVSAENNQKNYLKRDNKYWDSRLFPEVVKGGKDDTKFLKLNRSKIKLEKVAPSDSIDKTSTQKYIEKCRIINDTKDCANIEPVNVTGLDGKIIPDLGCGYCYDTDKIIFGNKNGPFTDICTTKGWVPPGNDTSFFCQKKKDQELCKTMTDCGDSTGEKSICAWCPLTASGMPQKSGPEGGFIPKYKDDKCDWKANMKDKSSKNVSFLGWSPNKGGPPKRGPVNSLGVMTPAPSPYGAPLDRGEGDCDNDTDCGPGMKCGHDGRGPDGKSGVPGLKYSNGSDINPNAGYKDYCYDPNASPKFDGDLIQPADCKRFEQMFPCVGPKMMTGPHSTACLQSQWQKSGCSGTLQDRVKDREDYNIWNNGVYSWAGDNMKEKIKKAALESSDYSKVEPAYRKCFGKEVDSCLPRFKPRPIHCSAKLYKNGGCTEEGKLNPENRDSWPNAYANQTWANGQKSTWSNGEFTNKVNQTKRDALRGQTSGTWATFDNVIDDNLKCFGKKPTPPFVKPCWKDFTLMMITMPGINISKGSISFDNAPTFKNLLVVKERGYWKNEYTWTGKYQLIKETYIKEHFPFWNFTRVARDYWNKNWTLFKSKMLKVPSVKAIGSGGTVNSKWYGWSPSQKLKAGEGDCDGDYNCAPGLKCAQDPSSLPGVRSGGLGGGRDYCYDPAAGDCNKEGLTFLSGSPFDNLTGQTTNKPDADNQGIFLKCGNNKFISQRAFQSTNFPYWYFIRVASVN